MVLGRNHGVCACTVGHAQAGTEVVRVGHAVKHQQQGLGDAGLLQLLQQLVERLDLGHRIDPGDHALMAMAAAHFGQAQAVGFNQPDTGFARPVGELAHPGIAAGGIEKNLQHRLGGGFQAYAYGMKAEKNFGGRRHEGIITAGVPAAVPRRWREILGAAGAGAVQTGAGQPGIARRYIINSIL